MYHGSGDGRGRIHGVNDKDESDRCWNNGGVRVRMMRTLSTPSPRWRVSSPRPNYWPRRPRIPAPGPASRAPWPVGRRGGF